jgi:hypothetical protein
LQAGIEEVPERHFCFESNRHGRPKLQFLRRYPKLRSRGAMSDLHVITTVYNPAGYKVRYRLHRAFEKRIQDAGALLYTIELASANQPFAVTDASNPRHFQVRSSDVIWYKENLINIALRRLPPDWKFAAWLDDDIHFVRPDWIEETLRKLEQHAFVQMFASIIDLGPNYQPLKGQHSLISLQPERLAAKARGETVPAWPPGVPGGAWAARRDALDAVSGLIDWGILGGNDTYMTLSLIGELEGPALARFSQPYQRTLLEWQERCERHIRRNVSHVDGAILHYWHGAKKNRFYDEREKILMANEFDPSNDLYRDVGGLLHLTDRKPRMAEMIKRYFTARNEDATELES